MTRKFHLPSLIVAVFFVAAFFMSTFGFVSAASADSPLKSGQRLITLHDREVEKSFITSETTLRAAFEKADIYIDKNDIVEPGLDDALTGDNYQVNVYRARPVTVVEGNNRIRIMSAYQTPRQIAQHAGLSLHDEDDVSLRVPISNSPGDMSVEAVVDRALQVKLVLYGEKSAVYTQSDSVDDLLKEKKITLGKNDTLSLSKTQKLQEGMTVEVWRNGKQTITRSEEINFTVRQIQDSDKKVGYREIKTPGEKGEKKVTYEVVMKNGKELKRKKIQSVTITKPKEQVEIVGAKRDFSGDFAAALAKLRSCEGGYNSWNPAGPYYGAYQFDPGTWSSVSNAPYGKASPAEQDAAARKLYERRGWQPWPVCGASLPDTFR